MTTKVLKAELARLLGFTAENLLRLAVVVNELEGRGEDLSGLRFGLLPFLRQIGSGKLLPEVVITFAGQPAAIKRIAALPLEEQRRIVDQGCSVQADPVACSWAGRLHVPKEYTPRNERNGDRRPGLKGIAANASPKDVAEMAAELVCNSPRPAEVVAELMRLLKMRGVVVVK